MVVDGQGGGIGATIIKRLRDTIGHELEILAFGTNSIATSQTPLFFFPEYIRKQLCTKTCKPQHMGCVFIPKETGK